LQAFHLTNLSVRLEIFFQSGLCVSKDLVFFVSAKCLLAKQTSSLAGFGFRIGLCDLTMCLAVVGSFNNI
jgi:hypothetical protein